MASRRFAVADLAGQLSIAAQLESFFLLIHRSVPKTLMASYSFAGDGHRHAATVRLYRCWTPAQHGPLAACR